MPGVFISYRRADSNTITGRVYDRLVEAFGEANIFKDVNDIPPGADFSAVLQREVSRCSVMLVMIGPTWANITDANGQKRLENPDDFVRLEVETGLKRADVVVIPVLVNDAKMPTAAELPPSLHDLVLRNAVQVRNDPDFNTDVGRLTAYLKQYVKPRRYRGMVWAAAIVGLAVVIVAAFVLTRGINNPPAATATPPATFTEVQGIVDASVSLFQAADTNSQILQRVSQNTSLTVLSASDDGLWLHVRLSNGTEGWVIAQDLILVTPEHGATPIAVANGFGARSDVGWQVYFTYPSGEIDPPSDCETEVAGQSSGIDLRLADAIGRVKNSLDIAAFEFNNCVLTQAVLEAKQRDVNVRVVTDDESGLLDEGTTLNQLAGAGIPIVSDNRSAFMHNKFMILDGSAVWTGSWNFTQNDTYRNNNNTLVFTAPDLVQSYQAEFDEMFVDKQFGPRSPTGNGGSASQGGTPIQILFAPEDAVMDSLIDAINNAQSSIRFMAFSFTADDLADAVMQRAEDGIQVQGIFERVGSETSVSEMPTLFCAGLDVRQDGSQYVMHHKVFIIDDTTVISGSFNFSANATTENDENLIIAQDADLAAQFIAEFERQWATATAPESITCP